MSWDTKCRSFDQREPKPALPPSPPSLPPPSLSPPPPWHPVFPPPPTGNPPLRASPRLSPLASSRHRGELQLQRLPRAQRAHLPGQAAAARLQPGERRASGLRGASEVGLGWVADPGRLGLGAFYFFCGLSGAAVFRGGGFRRKNKGGGGWVVGSCGPQGKRKGSSKGAKWAKVLTAGGRLS